MPPRILGWPGLQTESVVSKRAGVSVGENDHGMCAQGDGRILTTVGFNPWRWDALELCKIIPDA